MFFENGTISQIGKTVRESRHSNAKSGIGRASDRKNEGISLSLPQDDGGT
jgi:hypothetical protein